MITSGEVVCAGDAAIQVDPPLVEYSKFVISAPPLSLGAVKSIVAFWFPAVTDEIVGASGTVFGVTNTGSDSAPNPTELTARNFTE